MADGQSTPTRFSSGTLKEICCFPYGREMSVAIPYPSAIILQKFNSIFSKIERMVIFHPDPDKDRANGECDPVNITPVMDYLEINLYARVNNLTFTSGCDLTLQIRFYSSSRINGTVIQVGPPPPFVNSLISNSMTVMPRFRNSPVT